MFPSFLSIPLGLLGNLLLGMTCGQGARIGEEDKGLGVTASCELNRSVVAPGKTGVV